MLLAPKTLCAVINCKTLVDGKYGAKIQFSVHRRRRTLQAAQGAWMEFAKEDDVEGRDDNEDENEDREEENK